MNARLLVLLAALAGAGVQAQHAQHPGHGASPMPYAGMQDREIKALSAEERGALLEGQGMGLALAAELNGYPGPVHVLELADALQLTGEQRHATHQLMQAHKAEARELGAQVRRAHRRAAGPPARGAPAHAPEAGRLAHPPAAAGTSRPAGG